MSEILLGLLAFASAYLFEGPFAWGSSGAACMGIVAVMWNWRRAPANERRWAIWLLVPWAIPIAVYLLGMRLADACVDQGFECSEVMVVLWTALALIPIGFCATWRGRSFRLSVAFSAVVAMHATLLATVMALMSITDDWL